MPYIITEKNWKKKTLKGKRVDITISDLDVT